MAGKFRAVFFATARQTKYAAMLTAGLALAALSACNTGSVLSL
ncbi:extensin, partial [Mesorhizobium sp. M7A.T.Ca.TU.009.01.1.2]